MKMLLTMAMAFVCVVTQAQRIRVGAKHFNEGYLLSEMQALLLEQQGFEVARHYNLGGTLVCFEALRTGAIDVYPEYTGTLAAEILKQATLTREQMDSVLRARHALTLGNPYGFNNTYALVMRKRWAKARNIQTISDLAAHPDLRAGISYEFLKRQDGWDNLATAYQLPQLPTGLEHGLAYEALVNGKIDVTDAYSTDGEIAVNDFLQLTDDRNFFPRYEAVSLMRASLPEKAKTVLAVLENQLSEREMQALNAQVLYEKKNFREVAGGFLRAKGLLKETVGGPSVAGEVAAKTIRHLWLTFVALLVAMAIAVPAGIALYWHPRAAQGVLYVTGLLQTIPSIALLAMMIPLLGIGVTPAIVALVLYALLPIVRNTVTGLAQVDPLLKNVADGVGMTRAQRLRLVELPLAMPVILAGIRTAAVINVGTATLAAFIGAGGLGEFIVTGLALNNTDLILRGAIPAALLALGVEWVFGWMEKRGVPTG
ncbi:MAG: ABC transporter permease subunit [Cyclobacteriaceae bacterium]|jgi:osmoprotectant transport system permease protein|nr:ABC transporter permease subunit [Cyclobacteriaceae bacterium]